MKKEERKKKFENLPKQAVEYIRLIIKKMRYCKKVRVEVMAELAAHFEDELKDCKTEEEKNQKAQMLIENFGDPKLLGILLRRAKKRCRPLWRAVVARVFQAVGILIICLIVYVVWFLTGKPVITTDYIAELNRIVRPTADESQNAEPFYTKAVQLWIEEPDEPGNLLALTDWPVNLTKEQLTAVQNWIKANQPCFQQIKFGSEKPYYWRQYESKSDSMMGLLIPDLASYRRISLLMLLNAKIKASEGRGADSFDDILTCYKFGAHHKVKSSLVEQLVGMAIQYKALEAARQICSRIDIDKKRLNDFQGNLEKLLEKDSFTVMLDGEKLTLFDEIQRSFTGSSRGGHIIPEHIIQLYGPLLVISGLSADYGTKGYVSPSQQKQKSWLSEFITGIWSKFSRKGGFIYDTSILAQRYAYIIFLHPDREQTTETTQKAYNYMDRVKLKSPAQLKKEKIDIKKQIEKITRGNMLIEIVMPSLYKVFINSHLNKVNVYATITIIGLLRYNHDKGRYPDTLNELVSAGYLKEMPIDPYSDEPLVYKKTDAGFTLYSIGQNFVDDGGVLGTDRKGRPRMRADNGDWVFWPVIKDENEKSK